MESEESFGDGDFWWCIIGAEEKKSIETVKRAWFSGGIAGRKWEL